MKPLICALLLAALAGCASTSATDPERSVEAHGLFMSGGSVVRR